MCYPLMRNRIKSDRMAGRDLPRKALRDKFCRKASGPIVHMPTELQHLSWCLCRRAAARRRRSATLRRARSARSKFIRFRLGRKLRNIKFRPEFVGAELNDVEGGLDPRQGIKVDYAGLEYSRMVREANIKRPQLYVSLEVYRACLMMDGIYRLIGFEFCDIDKDYSTLAPISDLVSHWVAQSNFLVAAKRILSCETTSQWMHVCRMNAPTWAQPREEGADRCLTSNYRNEAYIQPSWDTESSTSVLKALTAKVVRGHITCRKCSETHDVEVGVPEKALMRLKALAYRLGVIHSGDHVLQDTIIERSHHELDFFSQPAPVEGDKLYWCDCPYLHSSSMRCEEFLEKVEAGTVQVLLPGGRVALIRPFASGPIGVEDLLPPRGAPRPVAGWDESTGLNDRLLRLL